MSDDDTGDDPDAPGPSDEGTDAPDGDPTGTGPDDPPGDEAKEPEDPPSDGESDPGSPDAAGEGSSPTGSDGSPDADTGGAAETDADATGTETDASTETDARADADTGTETGAGDRPSGDDAPWSSPPDADDEGGSSPALGAFSMDPVGWAESTAARLRTSRTFQVVVAITVAAIFLRLLLLGQRAAHWDEGRVAYWVLQYQQTGIFRYRPIVHGPFLFQVDKWLFAVLGPSDFVARLPVALVGGLMPAAAWLLRDHLRDSEVVALAALLSLNPLLFYYSRFMRNDVLVAGFMLFALGLFLRAYETRRPAYVYAGTVSFALGFTAKENALLYLACFLGALGLLLDHRLMGAVRKTRALAADGVGEGVATEFDDRTRRAITGDDIREWAFERGTPRAVALAAIGLANPAAVIVVPDVLGIPTWVVGAGAGVVVLVASAFLALDATPYHFVGPLAFLVVTPIVALFGGEEGLLLFTLAWILVVMLAIDRWLFLDSTGSDDPATLRGPFVDDWTTKPPTMAVAYVLLFGTLIFFFAPRNPQGPGLWHAVGGIFGSLFGLQFGGVVDSIAELGSVLEASLLGAWKDLFGTWIGPGTDLEEKLKQYPGRLRTFLETMKASAGVITGLSAVGFVVDRWDRDGPRDIVAFAGYWGVVSALGYPYATDIWAPWVGVHAVVALAIPASVAGGLILRWGVEAAFDDDLIGVAFAALVVLVLVFPMGVTAVDVGYLGSDTHERIDPTSLQRGDQDRNQLMMQWAQPGNDLKDTLGTVAAVARANEGHDVLFYGTEHPSTGQVLFYVPDEEECARTPPIHHPLNSSCNSPDVSWHSRLPLPWYMEAYGANVTSSTPENGTDRLQESPPPVVIAYGWDKEEVGKELPGRYEAHEHRFKLWAENVVIFIDRAAVPS